MKDTTLPISLTQQQVRSLLICIGFDLVGMLSYLLPGVSELTDIFWAPIAALAYFIMFRGVMGVMGGFFSFFEELMPLTDIIPTFTLSWMIKNFLLIKAHNEQALAKQ